LLVDETYLKVRGCWCYLYRAIERNGDLVDTMLSEHRDMAAAQAFFRSDKSATGITPDGGQARLLRAGQPRDTWTVGRASQQCLQKQQLEQDHQGVKGRIQCLQGFKSFASSDRFCCGYVELSNVIRPRTRHNQSVSASRRRLLHLRRATAALAIVDAA
jgi:transposase-like protein